MVDKLSRAHRSQNMAAIKSKGMKPEMIVRSAVHGMGYRYRLHRKGLPGKPDLVFGPRRKVIFVHGCFWHQHDDRDCKIARTPKSNTDYWDQKLARNVERDAQNGMQLEEAGWKVLTIWECQTKEEASLLRRLDDFLKN